MEETRRRLEKRVNRERPMCAMWVFGPDQAGRQETRHDLMKRGAAGVFLPAIGLPRSTRRLEPRFWHHGRVNDTPRPVLSDWPLDPEVTYLNHGAYGSCPRPVQRAADAFRARFERAPMQFVMRDAESLIDAARAAAGPLMGADGEDLVFVQNATTAVCTVLASLAGAPGRRVAGDRPRVQRVPECAGPACATHGHVRRGGARPVSVRRPRRGGGRGARGGHSADAPGAARSREQPDRAGLPDRRSWCAP